MRHHRRRGIELLDAGRRACAAGDIEFDVAVRIDTPAEAAYRHGGIMPYVVRQLLGVAGSPA